MKFKNKILACLVALLFFVPGQAKADIEDFCANKWPNDYKMRNYCQDQQGEANREFFSMAESKGLVQNGSISVSPSGGDYEKIFYQCMTKWKQARFKTYDYKMVVYCLNQQLEAYSSTSGGGTTGIEGFCADKWPNDYKMRKYCLNKQSEANREMFAIAESNGLVKNNSLSVSASGGSVERTFQHCMSKWKKPRFKTYDFTMVVYCLKKGY